MLSQDSTQNFIETETAYRTAVRSSWAAAVFFFTVHFHRQSAAGWAECLVAGPPSRRTILCGIYHYFDRFHARVALSRVLTPLLSTQMNDTQWGDKGHKPLPAP